MIIAAWLITFSFIIENYGSGNATVSAARDHIENYVRQQEKDFDRLTADSAFIKKVTGNNYDEGFLKMLTGKKYFFYHYFINDIG